MNMRKWKYDYWLDLANKVCRFKTGGAIPAATGMALLVFILWSCSPTFFPPVESDVAFAKTHWNDASFAQLNDGYHLYKNKCGSCHYLYRPDKFSREKWTHEISEMSKKISLDSSMVAKITLYILTAKETSSYKGPSVAGK